MKIGQIDVGRSDTDVIADEIIDQCLDPAFPKSFFLFAGAGSGKTESLKRALEKFRDRNGSTFRRAGKKIAVITFTKAAAEEIGERLGSDVLFPISTIHSFCWNQIRNFHSDIRMWLLTHLPFDLEEIRLRHAKGRGGKAAGDRLGAMAAIEERLEWLGEPRRFVYNPNGNNFGADSLSHSEVIKIAASFILEKPAMQAALVDKYPFLLVDESQDTNKYLFEALFELAKSHVGKFCLGLFGDTMQRIYTDGRARLEDDIPPDWARPTKLLNRRSGRRLVQLANALRKDADGRAQLALEGSEVGLIRLFIGSEKTVDKLSIERRVRVRMSELCEDSDWTGDQNVKTLTLEHHMAATRRGFLPMFQALDSSGALSTGLRSGELAGLGLFTQCVMPMVEAYKSGSKFAILNLLRAEKSALLRASTLAMESNTKDPLNKVREGVDVLMRLIENDPSVTFFAVLQCIFEHGLFEIPMSLLPFVGRKIPIPMDVGGSFSELRSEENESPHNLEAWRDFLDTPYRQIIAYAEYVAERGPYGTHQGVKGLQFDRVMVIIDDSEAKGFLFSYGKLFGVQPLTENDLRRAAEGEDTSTERTRRLLYVTCTRAKKSLALVVYTEEREALAESVVKRNWFHPNEIEMID
jgi:DNA helicase-2/ATP-dependent DNA helicase PcrA